MACLAAALAVPPNSVRAESAAVFSDVHPGDWYYEAVQDLASRGIVNGAGGRFDPGRLVNRAELAKMVVVALGYRYTVLQGTDPKQVFSSKDEAVAYASQFDHALVRDNHSGAVVWHNYPDAERARLEQDSRHADFSDVPYGTWYWPYVEGAWAAKIVRGTGPGQFSPEAPVLRQDIVTMIMKGLRFDRSEPDEGVLSPFADRDQISPYAVSPVATAVSLKILTGDDQGLLRPREGATRAQAAAMIQRMLLIPPGDRFVRQSKTVTRLEAVPRELKLGFGQRQPVAVVALRDDGVSVPVQLNWKVEGAVGSFADGVFQAGSQPGQGALVGSLATADGRTLSVRIPVTVEAVSPVRVELSAVPSTELFPGNKARVRIVLKDSHGQLVPGEVNVDVTLSDPGRGSLDVQRRTIAGGMGDLATFTAGYQPGPVVIRATISPEKNPGLTGSGDLTLTVLKGNLPVRGKGVWGTWVEWGTAGYDPDRIIQRAKEAGANYLYLIVRNQPGEGTIRPESKAMLDAIIPRAHANGIAVIGCVYLVDDPKLDTARMLAVARHTTPTGERVDGLAADIEESPTAETIAATMEPVRQALGSDYPIVAVTYPPFLGTAWKKSENYPWSSFGRYFDVISIMDYWHYRDREYTPEEVRKEILSEAQAAARLTGRPVEVIGQAYRMDHSDGTPFQTVPTAAEVTAAMQAAKEAGAVAFSLYRWDTATQEEVNAFRAFPW